MATVRYERRIAAPADIVWDVYHRPETIHLWFPGVTSCSMDGNIRTLNLANGIAMPEEIMTIDPVLRRFQYRVTSPLYRFHLGTIDTIALSDDECMLIYSTTSDPDVLALVIGGGTYHAMNEIARQAEARVAEGEK
jgi:hypothetical protein